MSDFNVEEFLSQTVGAMETEYTPVPVGEYNGMCSKLNVRGPKEQGQSPILELFWQIDAPGNPIAHESTVRQSIFLDTDAGSKLAEGPNQNIVLGQVRKAVRQNDKGKPWNPRMLLGTVARVHVAHRTGQPGTAYAGRIFHEVDAVAAL